MKSFSLRSIRLRSGEEYRDEIELELRPLEFGGQRYLPVPEHPPAELAITRATTGTVFQLRFATRIHGPCMRCLADAARDVAIDAREYQASSPGGSEELLTPYVEDDQLLLADWARDAIVLELPVQILCRPDCRGLCPVCGRDLNVEPHTHDETPVDPRWDALEQLRQTL